MLLGDITYSLAATSHHLVSPCSHAVANTAYRFAAARGRTLSFVYGLVPPPMVETAAKCPSGVAQVATQQSFLNGLVSGLTFRHFMPMSIKVTCAASGRSEAPAIRAEGDGVKAVAAAAELAMELGTPVRVRF